MECPIWTPEAWLARFTLGNTNYCNILNIAEGLMDLEKKSFKVFLR